MESRCRCALARTARVQAWCAGGAAPVVASARGCGRVFLAELVDAAAVSTSSACRYRRMAVRTHIDAQVLAHGRARLESVAAAAADGDLAVSGWIDAFMIDLPCHRPAPAGRASSQKKGAQSKPRATARQVQPAATWVGYLSTKSVDKSVSNGSPQPSIARHFCISVDLDTNDQCITVYKSMR